MFFSEFGVLCIRVTGLAIFARGVVLMPDYINYFLSMPNDSSNIGGFWGVVVIPVGISLIVGSILILFPISILNKLIPIKGNEIIDKDFRLVWNDQVVIIGVGLFLMFMSVSDIVYHLANIIITKSTVTASIPISGYNYPIFIASIAELLFAIFVCYKSEYIALKIRRIKV